MNTFIFDLYNTLIDIRTDEHRLETWEGVAEFFATYGIKADTERLADAYERVWREQLEIKRAEKKFLYPEGDIVTVFEEMAKSFGGELPTDAATEAARIMRRASKVWLRPFDGVLELFAKLRAFGAKIYLLSNAQAAFTYGEIEECGLIDKFDGMLISSEHGCRKPDPAYFQILFDKFGLDKDKSVMVGDDKESDGKGAKAFGIKYLWTPGGAAKFTEKLVKLAKEK